MLLDIAMSHFFQDHCFLFFRKLNWKMNLITQFGDHSTLQIHFHKKIHLDPVNRGIIFSTVTYDTGTHSGTDTGFEQIHGAKVFFTNE